MRPNPAYDVLSFLTKLAWPTAPFWLLLLGSCGIAAIVQLLFLVDPPGRSLGADVRLQESVLRISPRGAAVVRSRRRRARPPLRRVGNSASPTKPSEERVMEIEQVRGEAFAMPLTNPAFPPGPYRFINREFVIITYRTDRKALERVVPKPLEPIDDLVKYAFIRMPDSTGLRRLHRIGAGHPGGVRESGYNNPNRAPSRGYRY
jgi:hypothetical protein